MSDATRRWRGLSVCNPPPDPLPATRWRDRELRWGETTHVMAILNLTPDSFSGDGLLQGGEEAVAAVLAAQRRGQEADMAISTFTWLDHREDDAARVRDALSAAGASTSEVLRT